MMNVRYAVLAMVTTTLANSARDVLKLIELVENAKSVDKISKE